ncbi:hypothetical protein [Xanthomonas sp. NCPPB 2632]|uniref:hypothetical protein n=1 Tax=Xanthomonas sp. NCPPB 2632 TaxID=3240912 RepID=UPI003513D537
MESELVRRFAEAMTRADRCLIGGRLWVKVVYAGSQEKYEEWAPLRLDDLDAAGIRDPGFGSGPVRYSDVTSLHVHASPRPQDDRSFQPETLETYASKYRVLVDLVSEFEGVRVDVDGVSIG